MNLNRNHLAIALAASLLAVPVVAAALDGGSNAANKTAATGSTVEFLSETDLLGKSVLNTTIKTSAPQDLIFSVTMECALWTTVETVGNDVSTARATVTVKVLFDGVAVPVSGSGDDGRVVFCDRTHRQTTTAFDDENATINQYLATRSANGFNWILPDVGSGIHVVSVIADLETFTDSDLFVQAGVGHRTLIVEPTHLAQGFAL